MMRIYSHPRVAARRAVVETLSVVQTGQAQGGYVTNRVTKLFPATTASRQAIEKNGRGAQI